MGLGHISAMGTWAVVMTLPASEHLAARGLERLGIESYVPWFKDRVSKKDVRSGIMFPRYLFARDVVDWYSVRKTVGVFNVVSMGGEPSLLRDDAVAALKAREDEAGFIWLRKKDSSFTFRKNQRVRVVGEGPFAGLCGVYSGMAAQDREKVLLDILGANRVVQIPTSDLVAA